MRVSMSFSGGDALEAKLRELVDKMPDRAELRVGFLEDAVEPDGTSTAQVAYINEYGATINRDAGQVTVYRLSNKQGTGFLRKGRFVKASKANFSSTHATPAHTITIPPRPFFRNMIAKNKGAWGSDLATIAKSTNFDMLRSLRLMGERIKGQLQKSINETLTPPNARSTIRKKKSAHPLIDTGTMWRRVDYEISDSTEE